MPFQSSLPVIQNNRLISILGALGFLSCTSLLAAAYYFEYAMYMDPCPLCIVQRVITLVIGLSCLAVGLSYRLPKLQLGIFVLITLVGSFGIWVADHHVWIQNLPADQVPACGPNLAYMVETLPLNELIGRMLEGNGSCADISWSFLSLTMPEWMRVWFAGFTIIAIACFFYLAKSLRSKCDV